MLIDARLRLVLGEVVSTEEVACTSGMLRKSRQLLAAFSVTALGHSRHHRRLTALLLRFLLDEGSRAESFLVESVGGRVVRHLCLVLVFLR